MCFAPDSIQLRFVHQQFGAVCGKAKIKPIVQDMVTTRSKGLSPSPVCRVKQEESNTNDPIATSTDNCQMINQLTRCI